jgi:opacity protein-like surface antigen
MKNVVAAVLALALCPALAGAADLPLAYPPVAVWSWTGFYVGGHIGGGLGSSQFSDPAGPPIYGDKVRGPVGLGGGQIGYNWQVPNTNFVLGVDADADLMSGYASGTCFATSGFFISANCRAAPHAGGSVTGRFGWATGPHGRTLFYAKGGAAWLDERVDITTGNAPLQLPTSSEGVRWGWTAGAGVERALTPAWSLRLEYDYANFDDLGMATPSSFTQVFLSNYGYLRTPAGTTSVSQSLQTVKLGLNYKIGEDLNARWEPSASDYRLRGTTDGFIPDADIEVGGRVWYASGRFQKDLSANASSASLLISRLTYDTTSASGEVFGRLDTATNIFVKGFAGGGKFLSGNLHDEDWRISNSYVPYSNTLSNVTGDLAYGTFDVGYSLFRGPSANVGGFVGFNYYQDNKAALGCTQIANPYSDCVPPEPNSELAITENDKWYSLRFGLNGVVTLVDHLKLTAEAAYLPYVVFRGFDNHVQRTEESMTVSPESGTGQGVQLETILSYAVTNAFSVGAGGRYWAMWANGGYTNGFGTPCPCQSLPVRTDRYGGFLQASYKFDGLH